MQLFKDLTADTENMAENKGQTKQRFALGLFGQRVEKNKFIYFLIQLFSLKTCLVLSLKYLKKINQIGLDLDDSQLMQKCP